MIHWEENWAGCQETGAHSIQLDPGAFTVYGQMSEWVWVWILGKPGGTQADRMAKESTEEWRAQEGGHWDPNARVQGLLGILFGCAAFLLTFLLHSCPHLLLHGRRSRIWKGREGILLARIWEGLIFLLHQYVLPIGWRWVFTSWHLSGPVNSRFLIFTEQFIGRKEGSWGIRCQGLHWAMNHPLGLLFLPSLFDTCKWAFRPSEGDGKGLFGGKSWKSRRVVKRPSGNSETLVCLNLVIWVGAGQEKM